MRVQHKLSSLGGDLIGNMEVTNMWIFKRPAAGKETNKEDISVAKKVHDGCPYCGCGVHSFNALRLRFDCNQEFYRGDGGNWIQLPYWNDICSLIRKQLTEDAGTFSFRIAKDL